MKYAYIAIAAFLCSTSAQGMGKKPLACYFEPVYVNTKNLDFKQCQVYLQDEKSDYCPVYNVNTKNLEKIVRERTPQIEIKEIGINKLEKKRYQLYSDGKDLSPTFTVAEFNVLNDPTADHFLRYVSLSKWP